MYRFYWNAIHEDTSEGTMIAVTGQDVNHIKNVLRMKTGDLLILCNGSGLDYLCRIDGIDKTEAHFRVEKIEMDQSELPVRVFLYQGLPKKDKMELIIQKSVELGVYRIIPVIMHRTVVQLEEDKKKEKKMIRYNQIAESAAKQSGRGVLPEVGGILSFQEALTEAKKHDHILVPYEHAEGMEATRRLLKQIKKGETIGVFIGPEGGFEEAEYQQALQIGGQGMTLGKHILRTETAACTLLSFLHYEMG